MPAKTSGPRKDGSLPSTLPQLSIGCGRIVRVNGDNVSLLFPAEQREHRSVFTVERLATQRATASNSITSLIRCLKRSEGLNTEGCTA